MKWKERDEPDAKRQQFNNNDDDDDDDDNNNNNLWLTAIKGDTPVNQISASDWQMTLRRDNVISIALRRLIMS